jgi:hypothetical protein
MNNIVDKISWQWDIIKRHDHHINATNTKAALVLTFCVASSSALAYNCPKVWGICGASLFKLIAVLVFGLTFVLLIVSAKFAFKAIFPNVTPGNKSLISFVHIAEKASEPDTYHEEFSALSNEDILCDLCHQSVVLSSIANDKFKLLIYSVRWVKYALISMVMVFLLLGVGLYVGFQEKSDVVTAKVNTVRKSSMLLDTKEKVLQESNIDGHADKPPDVKEEKAKN